MGASNNHNWGYSFDRTRCVLCRSFWRFPLTDPVFEFLVALVVGGLAGVVGGLAGIGGSIIMLPALAIIFGYTTPDHNEQHLYIAAAMCVNVVVSFFSWGRHRKAGAVRRDIAVPLAIAMCTFVLAGVLWGSSLKGVWPGRAMIVFILGYAVYNIVATIRGTPEQPLDAPRPSLWKLVPIGAMTGVASGFLGIGGGIVLVPLLQAAKVPLRQAIASSAAVMWISAAIGATFKLSLLSGHELSAMQALALAGPMALGAVFGARGGATLTHRLKLPWLRTTIAVILAGAAVRMAYSDYKLSTSQSDSVLSGHLPETPADTPELEP